MFQTLNDIQSFIEENDVRMIDFKLTDIDGRWRHILIPARRLNGEEVPFLNLEPERGLRTWFKRVVGGKK